MTQPDYGWSSDHFGAVVGPVISEERAVPERVTKTREILGEWAAKFKPENPEELKLGEIAFNIKKLDTDPDPEGKKALISKKSGVSLEALNEYLEHDKRLRDNPRPVLVPDVTPESKISDYIDTIKNSTDVTERKLYDDILEGTFIRHGTRLKTLADKIRVSVAQLGIYLATNVPKLQEEARKEKRDEARKAKGGRRRTMKGRRKMRKTRRKY